ncbi:ATP-dependent DNA helicase mph1 [Elysia marginata]|uniref:ATP-dependent DNA helicase mph1 n=1 Tax=Elysia marginata TaxID=1093978 RepID=A0AAV4JH91_9GAST|nr:ATP-dependent DNA helicase mph1 [Elysia marginata]
MEFEDQEFSDEDDELLACADLPPENQDLNYDIGTGDMNFGDNFELLAEDDDNPANISIGADDGRQLCMENTVSDQGSFGFDLSTGKLWIYPTNYPVRDYQFNIVQQALFKNTLVVLPTGLGKTFIAAVVMYNFYRWFPQGKVVFMAPTKPLVAQQMQACYNIMGIPKSDTIEMTGTIHPAVRQRQWKDKRVIFLTPQVMMNDLSRGSCEAKSFKCLVVDEAHKALGNQSYCQVIRELCKFTSSFRVLALSATPGSTLKAVQTVMNNLLVSHIELRSEDSIDIKPYTHERKVEKLVVPLGEELSSIKEQYIHIMAFVTQRLIRNRALYNRQATSLSKFLLLKARDEFRQNPPQNIQPAQKGLVEADFCMAISLYHGYDLLQLHGLRSLYNFLMGVVSGEKGYGRTRAELLRNADFNSVMDKLHHKFSPKASTAGPQSDDGGKIVVGHPKMQVLEKIVVEHFETYKNKNTATKVVIFSQFRDSVQEIAAILNQHQPLVKVMPFIGQSSSGKDIKGFSQKEQLEVMRQFREAGCNTLVSTCVGEEGLDIGDVDLIICFDAHKSPIRLVQRMGRTGRKREGKIVMLVTEGKEEQIYNQSVSSKKSIHKAILNGAKSLRFYPNNPRMVPAGVQPQCHKIFITIPEENKKPQASKTKRASVGGKQRQSIADALRNQGKGVVGEDEDNYAIEMKQYVNSSFVSQSNITSFLLTPAKAKNESSKGNKIDLISCGGKKNNNRKEPSCSKHTSSYVVDSSDSEAELAQEDEDNQSMNKSKEQSRLFTEQGNGDQEKQVHSVKALRKAKKSLPGLHKTKNSNGKRQYSRSNCLLGTPPSSAKTRIRLLNKSKKTLQKRKSSLAHLLESKLTPLSELKDKDDFEIASPISMEQHNLDIIVNEEMEPSAEDSLEKNHQKVEIFSDRYKANVSNVCNENSEKTRPQKQLTLVDLSQNKEVLSGRNSASALPENVAKQGPRQMVPPAPSLSELDSLVDGLNSVDDFAELDLDKLVQDWGYLNDACKSFSENNAGFCDKKRGMSQKSSDVSKTFSNVNRDHNFSSGALEVSQMSGVFSENCVFPCYPNSKRARDRQENSEDKENPVSPTFKHSGQKHLNSKKVSHSKKNADTPNLHQKDKSSQDTSYGEAENPVVISPVKEATTYSSPIRDGDCIGFSPVENQDGQLSLPFFTNKKSPQSPLKVTPLSTQTRTEKNGKQNSLVFLNSKQNSNGVHEIENANLQTKSKRKCSDKKQNLSESFITFTQAHDCLLTSSSENSHEMACNESLKNSNNADTGSPTHSLSAPTKQRNKLQETPTLKANQSLMDKFLLSSSKNSATDMNKRTCNMASSLSTEVHELEDEKQPADQRMSRLSPQTCPQTPPKSENFAAQDDSFLANFDLGFDLDEEVIPPTPDKVSPQISSAMPCVKRPLFSDASYGTDQSRLSTENNSKVLPSKNKNISEQNNRLLTNNKSSHKNDQLGSDDALSDFDLCAELDELDPWPDNELGSQQLPKPSSDVKTEGVQSHQENHKLEPTELGRAVKWPINDAEGFPDSPQAPQRAELVFQNYKTEATFHEDLFPFADSNDKSVSSMNISPSREYKSKPSRLKLGKKRKQLSSNDSSANVDGIPNISSTMKVPEQASGTRSFPSTKPSKIRFNLKVPDFSESDDDIVFQDEIKPLEISPSNGKPLPSVNVSGNNSVSRESSYNFSTSSAQSKSIPQAMFSPPKVACSTPLRPHLNTGRGTSLCRDSVHALTPIPVSPERNVEETETGVSAQGKWLKRKKYTDMSIRNNVVSKNQEPFQDLEADDLDDFDGAVSFHETSDVIAKVKKRKLKQKTGFIEEEAEVSGDEGSSDEEEAEEGDYDKSFIDNYSETQGTDMQAMYLKSIKNPVPGGRYKLQFNTRTTRHEDIYSQAPEESQGLSEYEEDSFCVGSDEEESEMESPPKRMKKQKSQSKKLKQVSGKRVIRMLDSSSEEEGMPPLPMTQEFTTNCDRNKALLSSDEEVNGADKRKKRVKKIMDVTQNLGGESSLTDLQVHDPTEKRLHKEQDWNKGTFTLLKQSNPESNVSNAKGSNADMLFQDGDFNLLDDDLLQELDLPHAGSSKANCPEKEMVQSEYSQSVHLPCDLRADEQRKNSNNENFFAQKTTSPIFERNKNVGISSEPKVSLSSPSVSFENNSLRKPQPDTNKESNSNCRNKITTSDSSTNQASSTGNLKVSLSREERLQRQREKQERFRQKLAQAQQRRGNYELERKTSDAEISPLSQRGVITSPAPAVDVAILGQVDTKEAETSPVIALASKPLGTDLKHTENEYLMTPNEKTSQTLSRTFMSEESRSVTFHGDTPNTGGRTASSENIQLQILVDSREISGAQDIISSLRLNHGILVTAHRLPACDYIVSNHTAIERISWSNFSNSTSRSKLSSLVNEMQALYDRCVLVVEDDRVKSGQDKAKKQINHTKYLDTTMAYLMQTKVKVYFTTKQDETASVLADLCQAEARKGRNINVPASLSDRKKDMLNFVLSIPGVTVPQALNLVHKCPNITELVCSPVAVIQEKGQMMQPAAQSIHNFFQHVFDEQMMPQAKR